MPLAFLAFIVPLGVMYVVGMVFWHWGPVAGVFAVFALSAMAFAVILPPNSSAAMISGIAAMCCLTGVVISGAVYEEQEAAQYEREYEMAMAMAPRKVAKWAPLYVEAQQAVYRRTGSYTNAWKDLAAVRPALDVPNLDLDAYYATSLQGQAARVSFEAGPIFEDSLEVKTVLDQGRVKSVKCSGPENLGCVGGVWEQEKLITTNS